MKHLTIGEIVAKNILYADVFQKNKIDFCCKGNVPLEEAVQKKGIDIDTILHELGKIDSQPEHELNYESLSLTELINIIELTFHAYIRNETPDLLFMLKKIKSVHGGNHPELIELFDLFSESNEHLSHHMYKEEQVLFTYIKSLEEARNTKSQQFDSISSPIHVLKQEHEHEGDLFEKMRSLTNDYTPPIDACNTYKLALHKLKEFEEMLHKHIHLENNILFPKSVTLEKHLTH